MRLETGNGSIKNKAQTQTMFSQNGINGGNFYKKKKRKWDSIQQSNIQIQTYIIAYMDRPRVHKNNERFTKAWLVIHASSTKHK